MPTHLPRPTVVDAAGSPPKTITEHIGRASTGNADVSIAHMRSPAGWTEPAQRPDFDEYTLVLNGELLVEHDDGVIEVIAGEAVAVKAGERIRYRTEVGAEYVAVCLPAFSPDTVHRDDD
ncbi:MAG: cupin [Actinomycetota bacterium]|nr:cupin [Actinomycetota bacterium]